MDLTLSEGHHAMDWLEWSATIVKAVAWPVAAVSMSFIFRSQIAALLKRVRNAKWGDKEVDFSEELDIAEDITGEMSPRVSTDTDDASNVSILADAGIISRATAERQDRSDPESRFEALVAVSPESAIIDAWHSVAGVVRVIYEKSSVREGTTYAYPIRHLIKCLAEEKVIEPSEARALSTLSDLRDKAAHSVGDITMVDAFRFKILAEGMLITLRERFNLQRAKMPDWLKPS
jgi:uncharacterized protein YutE (UPF0331/DUF86 family)